jgi:hypothetical protein
MGWNTEQDLHSFGDLVCSSLPPPSRRDRVSQTQRRSSISREPRKRSDSYLLLSIPKKPASYRSNIQLTFEADEPRRYLNLLWTGYRKSLT